MNFSLVVISLLGIVGIDQCWGNLTTEEMTQVARYFSMILEAFDGFIIKKDPSQTSNCKETYNKDVQSKIKKGEEAFKTFTISSLEKCANILKETNTDKNLRKTDKVEILSEGDKAKVTSETDKAKVAGEDVKVKVSSDVDKVKVLSEDDKVKVFSETDKVNVMKIFVAVCYSMKNDEKVGNRVIFKEELQRLYVEVMGGSPTEKNFNNTCLGEGN